MLLGENASSDAQRQDDGPLSAAFGQKSPVAAMTSTAAVATPSPCTASLNGSDANAKHVSETVSVQQQQLLPLFAPQMEETLVEGSLSADANIRPLTLANYYDITPVGAAAGIVDNVLAAGRGIPTPQTTNCSEEVSGNDDEVCNQRPTTTSA